MKKETVSIMEYTTLSSERDDLKKKNKKLKKKLHMAKELLKYYYSRYEFCGTAKAPSWKVKEDTEKLLKGEEGREYFYPSEYYEKEKTND